MPTLNVILHGLMAICEDGDKLHVFLPNVTDVHVFRAGSWLGETELVAQDQPYELTGVKTGDAQFDRSLNVHLGQVQIPPTSKNVTYAVLQLPRPKQINSIRTADVHPADDFEGADAGRVSGSQRIATTQVLVYDFDDIETLALNGHNWTPTGSESNVVNLHVFAEEELPDEGTIAHALAAFSEMVKGITGLDLRMKKAQQAAGLDPTVAGVLKGVDPLETEDLAKRQSRFIPFGNVLRQVLPSLRQYTAGQRVAPPPSFVMTPFSDGHPVGSKTGSCTMVIFSR